MPSILNKIGFFQFENLIKNRIPFILFAVDFEMPEVFGNFHEQHVVRSRVNVTKENLLSYVKENNLPKDQAIVLICQNGNATSGLVDQLESEGFQNIYFVDGGWENLRKEQSEG